MEVTDDTRSPVDEVRVVASTSHGGATTPGTQEVIEVESTNIRFGSVEETPTSGDNPP